MKNVTQIFGYWVCFHSGAKGGEARSPTYLHILSL